MGQLFTSNVAPKLTSHLTNQVPVPFSNSFHIPVLVSHPVAGTLTPFSGPCDTFTGTPACFSLFVTGAWSCRGAVGVAINTVADNGDFEACSEV